MDCPPDGLRTEIGVAVAGTPGKRTAPILFWRGIIAAVAWAAKRSPDVRADLAEILRDCHETEIQTGDRMSHRIIYDEWTADRGSALLVRVQRAAPELEWEISDTTRHIYGRAGHGFVVCNIAIQHSYRRDNAADVMCEVLPPWVIPGLPPRARVAVSWTLTDNATEDGIVDAAKTVGAWIRTGSLAPAGSVSRGKPPLSWGQAETSWPSAPPAIPKIPPPRLGDMLRHFPDRPEGVRVQDLVVACWKAEQPGEAVPDGLPTSPFAAKIRDRLRRLRDAGWIESPKHGVFQLTNAGDFARDEHSSGPPPGAEEA